MEEVKKLLKAFGCTTTQNDQWMLDFILDKVQNHIHHTINRQDIPEGLKKEAVQMAAGEFLLFKKSSGQLDIETVSLEAIAKSITAGDTSVTFSTGEGSQTPEQRLNTYIQMLLNPPEACFYAYRRLVW